MPPPHRSRPLLREEMREKHSAYRSWAGFAFHIVFRVVAKLLAPLAVLFLDDVRRKWHPIWGVEDASDLSYWNIAIRNAAHNCFLQDSVPHTCSGDLDMEEPGLKKRHCKSDSGKYRSYRVTWGDARPKKGKREFYIGWTLSQTRMRPVIQLRPF